MIQIFNKTFTATKVIAILMLINIFLSMITSEMMTNSFEIITSQQALILKRIDTVIEKSAEKAVAEFLDRKFSTPDEYYKEDK